MHSSRFIPLLGALLLSIAMPGHALEYPDPENPISKAFVDRYRSEKQMIDAPDYLEAPKDAQAWACNVPELTQYTVAGVQMALPEVRAKTEKDTRKYFREQGLSADMVAMENYSNIRIIPLRSQCKDGKLDGEVEVMAFYDTRMETHSSTPSGDRVVKGVTVMTTQGVNRIRAQFKNGEALPGNASVTRRISKSQTRYDDPAMESVRARISAEAEKPMEHKSITYIGNDGSFATFFEMQMPEITPGFLAPSVKTKAVLSSMFTERVDEARKRMVSYTDKNLTGWTSMKNDKFHGEQVTYTDNYLKKMNLRIDQQPNMSNAKEVTINGVDLLETRNCWQDGVQIKIATCSND